MTLREKCERPKRLNYSSSAEWRLSDNVINQGWEKESLQYGGHRRSSLLLKKKLKKIAKAKAIDQTISSSNSQAKL